MELFLTNPEIFVGSGALLLSLVLSLFFYKQKAKELPAPEPEPVPQSKPAKAAEPIKAEPLLKTEPVAEARVEVPQKAPAEKGLDWSSSKTLSEALINTEKGIWGRIRSLFVADDSNPEIELIEEILYTSDLGPKTVTSVMSSIEDMKSADRKNSDRVKATLRESLKNILLPTGQEGEAVPAEGPLVIMVVGVNGAGKTTSIGKLSAHYAHQGKKVMVVAGDTFRAAAVNQLKVWTERAGVSVFSPEGVSDPAAVAFDGLSRALSSGMDVVIVDTAGRLHTSAPLMEELKKMKRVMTKVVPAAPHQTVIVLDANSGQNAMVQAREFNEALSLTGVILTKLDGTAKGGVAFGIVHELKVPIRWIGIGEKLGDLRPFDSASFVDSILPP